jgi:hypothetical protein
LRIIGCNDNAESAVSVWRGSVRSFKKNEAKKNPMKPQGGEEGFTGEFTV